MVKFDACRAYVVAVALFSTQALAQEAPKGPVVPEFVPFVVDRANYDAVKKYLGGLKFDDAAPVVNWLETLETKAKQQWLADNGPKDEGAK